MYPQTYFPHSAGKEELEALTLSVGLTLRGLLGGSSSEEERRGGGRNIREEEEEEEEDAAAHSLAVFDETLGLRRDGWSLMRPLEDVINSSSRGEGDTEEGERRDDALSASALGDEGLSTADASPSPSASRTVDPVEAFASLQQPHMDLPGPSLQQQQQQQQQQQREGVAGEEADAAADAEAAEAAAAATEGSFIPSSGEGEFDAVAAKEQQQGSSSNTAAATHDGAAEPLIEKIRQEFEQQARQQRLLLRRMAAQQKQQSRMQEQQAKLLMQQQQQQHQQQVQQQAREQQDDVAAPLLPPYESDAHEASTLHKQQSSEGPSSSGSAVRAEEQQQQQQASESSSVVFPGINAAHESDTATRRLLLQQQLLQQHQQQRQQSLRGYGDFVYNSTTQQESEHAKLRQMLEEQYGPLFLNIAGLLLRDSTLHDLITVAEWHLNPETHKNLCKERRFSLFVRTGDPGRYRLMITPVESSHRHAIDQMIPDCVGLQRLVQCQQLAAATEADTADAAVLREDAAVDTPVSPLSPEPSEETEESGSPQRFIGAAIDALTGNAFSLDPVEMHGGFFSQEPEPLSDAAVEKLPIDDEKFDFIIVGGGAAGCAAADILSQSGKKVLLLERGMQRTRFTAPNAMSARGAGIGLADATISQPVGTVQGVRTFSGAVMGGGSAVNLGIVIGETEDYFKEMSRQFPGYNIQYDRLKRAYEYVGWKVARAMPVLPPFGNAYSDALTATGYRYWGGGSYPQPSLFVQPGYQWVGYSLFDAGNNFQRNASDALLEKTPNLLIKTRHTARKVTFIDTPQGKTANCVVYRPTKYQDIRPIGDLWSLFPSSAADWAPWVGSFLEPTSVLTAAGVDKPKSNYRRVCLANPGKGRIVLSAGAVHTPLILYRSGIGPAIQLSLLKVPQVLENPAVGSAFSDRVFLSIPGFLKHYTDSIPLINPVRSLRRLAANEDAGSQNVTKLRLLSRPSYEPILSQEQLEKAITPEVREAVEKILNQSMPVEVITIDEDDDPSFRTGFDPPVLFPDNLMFPGPLHYLAPALQPRVCQFMGLRYMGPHCKGPRINERNLGCSLVTMEELSGDRLAEGFIYASRYMFPTAFRKDPILDAMTEILQGCSNYRAPFGLVLLKPLCVIFCRGVPTTGLPSGLFF
ncbi:LOW QUALITY PROTEIN: oxidoreductase, putative [Eimeria mitis]|uniref:Oxidoreductase, putative n=1 Tax=Eimeria mitis TaxID=44415 RepID=U6JSQ0_9EIME|nr:LOW QUALITY PROTEIN: oxidoreductase, putative [Eimeria mitis]CDJ28480.1 oxidoreductase, putative [Eimeria mitis]